MVNKNLHKAKKAKNDEFYTQFNDIQNEMNAYIEYNPDVFRGKTILCPCDDYKASNFQKFFALNFERFGLKKLICTSYAHSEESQKDDLEADEYAGRGKLYILTGDTDGSGNIDTKDIVESYLEGDGDFRSEEVKALRDEADFIITNPPFSLFREFIAWIMEADKKFIIIGNQNAITYKEVFPLIMENKMWLGATANGSDMVFGVPDGYKVAEKDKEKAKRLGYIGNYTRLGNSSWFTNVDHGKRHKRLALMTMEENLKYSKHKQLREQGYLKYDNYDAIEVSFVDAIPSDYEPCWFKCPQAKECVYAQTEGATDEALCEIKCNGAMGVPITYLDKHNPDDFEIIKFRKGNDDKDLSYTIDTCEKFNNEDKTRQDKTRQDKTRQDKTRQDKTRQDKSYSILQDYHQEENVMELWESQSHSSINSAPSNSKSSTQIFTPIPKQQPNLLRPEPTDGISTETVNTHESSSVKQKCNGIMGVPITFLDKYNPEQYEIFGQLNVGCFMDKHGWQGSNGKNMLLIAGKTTYKRVLIRKRFDIK